MKRTVAEMADFLQRTFGEHALREAGHRKSRSTTPGMRDYYEQVWFLIREREHPEEVEHSFGRL